MGFKKFLLGISDAGSRLLFKFRSGTHGLTEELGRHRGREGKVERTLLCAAECESAYLVVVDWSLWRSFKKIGTVTFSNPEKT